MSHDDDEDIHKRKRSVLADERALSFLSASGTIKELKRRGWLIEALNGRHVGPFVTAVLIDARSDRSPNRSSNRTIDFDGPIVELHDGIVPGHIRICEKTAINGTDNLLPRLVRQFGPTLKDDAVSGALSLLPPTIDVQKTALDLVSTSSHDAWRQCGPSFLADWHRDIQHKLLAVDVLFNNVRITDELSIARLLDRTLNHLARPPVRSVSIVITNYNYLKYLPEAIESAVMQTVPAAQVIVVDDGSTDGSSEFLARQTGIIPVLQPNRGQAAAMNAGFQQTTGDLVLFLDADDRLAPNAVERLASAAPSTASRYYFQLELIDAFGRSMGLYAPTSQGMRTEVGHLAGALATNGIFSFMPTSGNAFPRRVLETLMPMPEQDWRICADLWLVLMAATLGEAVELPEILGQYRVHGTNAYFRELGGEHYLQPRHRQQRRVAWRDIIDRTPADCPKHLGAALRTGLHRRMLFEAEKEGFGAILREVPRAFRVAAAAHGATGARFDFSHALAPLGSMGRLLRTKASSIKPRDDVRSSPSLLQLAGPSTWPIIGAGASPCVQGIGSFARLLGHGWAPSSEHEPRLSQSWGSLAFRIADIGHHWRLRLGFAIEGTTPVRDVRVSMNGSLIDRLDLSVIGEIELRLPRELLVPWRYVLGSEEANSLDLFAADFDLRAVCLLVEIETSDLDRLRLTSFCLEPLVAVRAYAPLLPLGRFLPLSPQGHRPPGGLDAAPHDNGLHQAALSCFRSGWEWPDTRGIRLRPGAVGVIALALEPDAEYALTLVWGEASDSPRGSGIANCLLVSVNDTLTSCDVARDQKSITIAIPKQAVGDDGDVKVGLMAFADPTTSAWPTPALHSIRLDRLSGGAPGESAWGQGSALVPNRTYSVGHLVASDGEKAVGLVVDGEGALIVGSNVALGLTVSPSTAPIQLEFGIAFRAPTLARFQIDDRIWEILGAGECSFRINLPFRRDDQIAVQVAVKDPGHGVSLQSVRMEWIGPAMPKFDDAETADISGAFAAQWSTDNTPVDPGTLFTWAERPEDWHSPLEDALWLASHETRLLLPGLPENCNAIEVSVVTLDAYGQYLTFEVDGNAFNSNGSGINILKIPISAPREGFVVTIRVNRLIASQVVGIGDVGLLGGAILAIQPLSDDTANISGG